MQFNTTISSSTGTDSSSDCVVSKERKSNPKIYKRNVIWIAKVKDKEHVNWKAKHVKGRNNGSNCNCSKMCFYFKNNNNLLFIKVNNFL